MRVVDIRQRENQILKYLVQSYIDETRPISSTYLCKKYNLPCSSATVRNVLESLERKGYISHVHTSSGRIPTSRGFRRYVEFLKAEESFKDNFFQDLVLAETIDGYQELFNTVLDTLSNTSGYTSVVAMWGKEEGFYFRGSRFILEQPEFEDIIKLRGIFNLLESNINQLYTLLENYIDQDLTILIGDETGYDEMSECSLVVSGAHNKDISFTLGLLGPMRMNYTKAASSLYSMKHLLEDCMEKLI